LNIKAFLAICVLTLFSVNTIYSQVNSNVVNLLGTPNKITIGNIPFFLAWSSHPSAIYYKQEYLPKNENVEKFNQMLFIDVLIGNEQAKYTAEEKIKEINARKSTDAEAQYKMLSNSSKNETVLEFTLSAGANTSKIIEWNVYRYINTTDKAGTKILLLFCLSKRTYGKDASKQMANFKANKDGLITSFNNVKIPTIAIKQ